MKIRVNEFVHLYARRTAAAGVAVATVAAKDVTGKSNGYWKFAVTRRTCQQQRMSESVFVYHAAKLRQQALLSYYILEKHI
jgi:hypothetical protein